MLANSRLVLKALLASKWAHVVCGAQALGNELDNEERELLRSMADMLREEEAEPGDSSPLAARLLRYWASFYEDTWVWGGKSGYLYMPTFSHVRLCSMLKHVRFLFVIHTKSQEMQSRRAWQSFFASLRVRTNLARGRGL